METSKDSFRSILFFLDEEKHQKYICYEERENLNNADLTSEPHSNLEKF